MSLQNKKKDRHKSVTENLPSGIVGIGVFVKTLEIHVILHFICDSMSCSSVKIAFLSFKKKGKNEEEANYGLLPVTCRTTNLDVLSLCLSLFLRNTGNTKRAQEQSDMLLYSIFGAYENGQHCSSEAHRMLVKHSIVLASSLIFLDYDRTTV